MVEYEPNQGKQRFGMFLRREMSVTALFMACVATACGGLEAAPSEIRVGAGTPNATLDAALE